MKKRRSQRLTKKIFLFGLVVCLLTGCAPTAEEITITNSVRLNTTTADMSGYKFLEDEDPAFVQITYAESLRMFMEGGSGILFYGYEDCYYCNRAVPVLNEVAKEAGITIYYIDTYDTTDTSRETYDELMTYLEGTFQEEEDTGEMAFYVPDVVGIKEGKLVSYHVSLTDGFIRGNESKQLTRAQKNSLKQDYIDVLNAVKD